MTTSLKLREKKPGCLHDTRFPCRHLLSRYAAVINGSICGRTNLIIYSYTAIRPPSAPPPPTSRPPCPKKNCNINKNKRKDPFYNSTNAQVIYIYIYVYNPPPTHGSVLPERPADINAAWRESAGAELEHGPHMETVNLDVRLGKKSNMKLDIIIIIFLLYFALVHLMEPLHLSCKLSFSPSNTKCCQRFWIFFFLVNFPFLFVVDLTKHGY